MSKFISRVAGGALFLALALGFFNPVHAAGSVEKDSPDKADFLFGVPKASFAARGGWSVAGTNSEIFELVQDELTVETGDFNAPILILDLTYKMKPQIDAMFRFGYSRVSVDSESRDYVDQDDNPILQTTELKKIPLTGNVKFYLLSRGREISRFAYVPRSFAPYVGGGGGLLWYRFRQVGDFVDFEDLSIFSDAFTSDGWTPTLNVFGGIDIKLTPRLFLAVEASYYWAKSDMGADFVNFDPIDLAGLAMTVGLQIVF
jgi:outer membrane protein W